MARTKKNRTQNPSPRANLGLSKRFGWRMVEGKS